LCGGLLGLERQLRGKPAGMRTSILICLGTMVFVALGAAVVVPSGDPGRVLGQVVTGIGFLGAGVILTREGIVIGVTSAAAIWLLAAIGSGIALGFERASIAITFIALGILVGVEALEASFASLRRGVHALRSRSNPVEPE
jgi:putative Mg2+ transporter-C (MgtC) family protein